MKTNFFTSIAATEITADLKLTIRPAAADKMLVILQVTSDKIKDKAFPSLRFTDTPENLDNSFFAYLLSPPSAEVPGFTDKEAFLKQISNAVQKIQPKPVAAAQPAANKPKPGQIKDPAEKKYLAQMAKVADLEKENKYRLAYAAMPKPEEFPTHTEEIKKKKSALMALISEGTNDLFSSAPSPAENPASAATTDEQEQNEEVDEDEEDDFEQEDETSVDLDELDEDAA